MGRDQRRHSQLPQLPQLPQVDPALLQSLLLQVSDKVSDMMTRQDRRSIMQLHGADWNRQWIERRMLSKS